MLLTALGLGLMIGLVIGALGGGGSILTVPALVFALALSAQEATTGSLVIVGITAVVAGVARARGGTTRWRTALLLAAAGVPASVLGTRLNHLVDENVLLLLFAALMLVAAAGMLLRSHPHADVQAEDEEAGYGAGGGTIGGAVTTVRPAPASTSRGAKVALRLALAGLLIGFLTGFFGVGGGFVIVPILVIALGFPMPVAVGTSLLVIALNSAVALVARIGHSTFAWDVIVPFTLAAVVASLLGKKAGDRVTGQTLTRAFAVLLVAVAAYVATRAVLALS
jgi:uncharacterized membrane protein YfcA